MLGAQYSPHILYHEELGLLGSDKANIGQEHLASFILQTPLLASLAPRLAGRTADEAVTFGYLVHAKFSHVFLAEIGVGMVVEIGIMHGWVVVVRPNDIETCLLKS